MCDVVDQLGAVPVGLAVGLAPMSHLFGPTGMYAEDAKHSAAQAKKSADSAMAGLNAVRTEAISARECRQAANVACDQARAAVSQARLWAILAAVYLLMMLGWSALEKLHII